MVIPNKTEVESQTIELSTEAFNAFCEDISTMFEVDMTCEQQEVCDETVAGLKKRFKKLAAVNVVDSKGILDGTFQLIFDQEGLFTLGGVIVMLPEKTIMANRKDASAELAESMVDAVGEAGNLLVGSWDRIFREGLDGHGHFSQRLPAFVGKPWDKSEEKIGLNVDEELVFIPYEMTIGSFPAFKCGVIFPKTIFVDTPDSVPEEEPAAEQEVNEKAEQENPEMQIPTEQAPEDTSEETPSEKDAEEGTDTERPDFDGSDTLQSGDADASKPDEAVSEKDLPEEIPSEEDMGEVAETNKTDSAEQTPSTEDDSVVEESVAGDGPVLGKISETIQKMAKSLAESPEESVNIEAVKSITLENISELSQIRAEEIMQNQIIWISPEDSVQRALATMQQNNAGYLMVGKNGVLEGIVSQSDITGAISPYLRPLFTKWRRPSDDATLQIKIKWIMSKPVHTVGIQTSMAAVIENMSRLNIRALPVVDKQDKVKGLITVFEIFSIFINKDTTISTVTNTSQESPSE